MQVLTVVFHSAFLTAMTLALEGLNVIVNLNGLGVNNIIIAEDSDDDINIENKLIEEFQEVGVPWAVMTFEQLVSNQVGMTKALIVIAGEKKEDWSSTMMAENQFLILTPLQPNASVDAMKEIVMEKISRLGMVNHLRYDSQVYVGFTDYLSAMKLFEVYVIADGWPYYINQLNDYSDFIWVRRGDLKGLQLKAGCAIYKPVSFYSTDPLSDIVEPPSSRITYVFPGNPDLKIIGLDISFFSSLIESLNLTIEFHLTDQFGIEDEVTKVWTGIIGQIASKNWDMSACHLSLTIGRSEVVDFLQPMHTTVNKLFVKKPKAAYSWTAYTDVFNNEFWFTIAATSFVISASISLARVVMMKLDCSAIPEETAEDLAMVLRLVGMLNAEFSLPQRRWSVRCLQMTTWFFGSMVLYSFSAMLTSSLTVINYTPKIQSLQDLVTHSGYQLMMIKGYAIYDQFRYSNPERNDVYHQLWNKMIKDNSEGALVNSMEEAEKRLLNSDNYVLINELESAFSLRDVADEIMIVGPQYFELASTFAIQKGSPYRRALDYHWKKVGEFGNTKKAKEKLLKRYFNPKKDAEFRPFGFANTIFLFVSLLVGIGSSIFLALFEFLINWISKEVKK